MRKQMLITVASAALIAGMSGAMAQAPEKRDAAPAGKMTQDAPKQAPKAAAPSNAMPKASETPAAKSEMGKPSADTIKSGTKATTDTSVKAGDKAKTDAKAAADTKTGTDTKAASDTKAGADTKAASDTKAGTDTKAGAKAETKSGASSDTTGQGAAASRGAAVQVTSEQRTKIKSSINIASAPKVTNVNFSITVGTKVPRDRVQFRPLPATIVEVVPAYRGYLYFVVDDRIIIVDPNSYEIVIIIT